MLSSSSWQEVENNELGRRKRAESLMSTLTADGGDVDFLSSSLPHDTLADMMTSKEVSQSGNVSSKRNITCLYEHCFIFCGKCAIVLYPLFHQACKSE